MRPMKRPRRNAEKAFAVSIIRNKRIQFVFKQNLVYIVSIAKPNKITYYVKHFSIIKSDGQIIFALAKKE